MISFDQFYNSIWMKVPEVWRSADDDSGRALQVLIYTWSQHMYHYFYNKISNMDELFDPDVCPTKYLKFLSSMIGWELVGNDEKSWREQIKVAPLLYKLKGTQKGLTIAEKLVGYSVFISELYRDHVGDLVPKERIFNNIPNHIQNKPWFKTVALDENGHQIPGNLVSDQFDSFNDGSSFMDSFGNIVRPSIDTEAGQLSYTNLSTTSSYDNITGEGSLARYAKTPRINVVLKKIDDLDSVDTTTGLTTQNNLSGALELLLQFKPFNIRIENIDVLFDVSDYISESTRDASNAEMLISNETFDFVVHIEPDMAHEKIRYCENYTPESPYNEEFSDTELPNILASFYTINIQELPRVSDLNLLKSYSFSNFSNSTNGSGTPTGYCILNDRILSIDDFLTDSENAIIFNGAVDYVDRDTRSIRLSELPVKPTFTFRRIDLPLLSTHNLLDFDDIRYNQRPLQLTSVSATKVTNESLFSYNLDFNFTYETTSRVIVNNGSFIYKGTLLYSGLPQSGIYTLNINLIDSLDTIVSSSVHEVTCTRDGKYIIEESGLSLSNGIYTINITISPTTVTIHECSLNNIKAVLNYTPNNTITFTQDGITGNLDRVILYDTPLTFDSIITDLCDKFPISLICVKGSNCFILPKTAYRYISGSVILDTQEISQWLEPTAIDDSFLNGCKIMVCFLEMPHTQEQFNPDSTSRDSYIPSRSHSKFTRQYSVDDTTVITSGSVKADSVYTRNPETFELERNPSLEQLYQDELPYIFTRGYLSEATDIYDGTPLISKDPLDICDRNKWKVYSRLYSSFFFGSQQLTQLWWSDYYQTESTDLVNYLIDYKKIDKSPEAQLVNRISSRWQTAIKGIDETNPKHFLATRRQSATRAALWNRSSAKRMSRPYEGSSRALIQRNRNTPTLFSKSDNMSDYAPSVVSVSDLSNYKYVLNYNDTINVTHPYFNPSFELSEFAQPETEFVTVNKIKIHPTIPSYIIGRDVTDSSVYDCPTTYANRSVYYSNESSGALYYSLYAGNLPTTSVGVLSEACDSCSILIDGAKPIRDSFTVAQDNITGDIQKSFVLTYLNLYLCWFRNDTGEFITTNQYSNSVVAVPNILVYVNGIQKLYQQDWTLFSDYRNSIQFTSDLQAYDIVDIYYNVLDDEITKPLTVSNTILSNIFVNVENNNSLTSGLLFEIQLPSNIQVSWTDNITKQFLFTQTLPGVIQPFINFETAYPDVNVIINGIQYKYGVDWVFKHKSDIEVSIVLLHRLSYNLTQGDSVLVTFQQTN